MESSISPDTLRNLADAYDIQPEWRDIWGNSHHVDNDMYQALLSAMGIPIETEEQAVQAIEDFQRTTVARWLEPVLVLPDSESRVVIPVHLPSSWRDRVFKWTLESDMDNEPNEATYIDVRSGQFNVHELYQTGETELAVHHEHIAHYEFFLEGLPPQGYYRFKLQEAESGDTVDMLLVVTPTRCFMPEILHNTEQGEEARVWGPAVQLYAAHSNQSWGIGDYGDLLKIIDWSAEQGAAMIGLNPLHALFPHNPSHSSPYSPSSRMFFNALLLDIEAIEDFQESEELKERTAAPEFHALLNSMRAETLIPYGDVGRLKFDMLERLFQHFLETHLRQQTERGEAFTAYVTNRGPLLALFALFHALQDHFYKQDPMMWGWPVWPEEYQDPNSAAVAQFLSENADRVAYYQYLQWQTEIQLARASARCKEKNLGIGLYMDMAVGVDRSGADVWANRRLFAQSSAVGAPPDEYNQKGQDWGLPPLIPERMREEQYRSFIQILRQNMRHAGALRMDHVMGLMRLFWIPPGLPPSQGAYIHYAVDELFGILALESQRCRCLIIGEDMGTVPDIVRDRMNRWGVFSYKVFFFEKETPERFMPPEHFLDSAAVAVSTHDLPTLAGFWQSRDIAIRTELDLYPTPELQERQIRERALERVGILHLLQQHGLLPAGMIPDPNTVPAMTTELTLAVHRYVARTRSKVFMVQFEDLLNQIEQINLPGTTEPTYPCWRRRLTLPLDLLFTDQRVTSITRAISEERPKPVAFQVPQAVSV
jgi:4-alpha-glucanotransferase